MNQTIDEQLLIEKAKRIVERIRSIKNKTQIFQPSRPIEPKEPKEPNISYLKKPDFLDLSEFLILFVLISFPLFFILIWIVEENYFITTIMISSIISLIYLSHQYSKSIDSYNLSKKSNETRQREYEWNFKEYRDKYSDYGRLLTKYNEEVTEYDKNKHLRIAVECYKKELAELLKIDGGPQDKLHSIKFKLSFSNKAYLPDRSKLSTFLSPEVYENSYDPKDDYVSKAKKYLSGLDFGKKLNILNTLEEVQVVQNSNFSASEKSKKIKKLLWTEQSRNSKLLIGGLLGTVFGLTVFGTGGIGIAALGGAIGVWGWLATAAGGVFISSLVQNFDKSK